MILIVLCPGCGNTQKCSPKGEVLTKKVKRCVYCGRSFRIHSNIKDTRIVKTSH